MLSQATRILTLIKSIPSARQLLIATLGLSLHLPAIGDTPIAVLEHLNTSQPMVLDTVLNTASELQSFYSGNDYAWFKQDQLQSQAGDLVAAIERIDGEGLLPSDYHLAALQNHCAANTIASQINECELILSDAFLTLAQHLASGKVNPESLTPEWKTKSAHIQAVPLLEQIKAGKSVGQILTALRPKAPEYAALITELQAMRAKAKQAPAWPAIAITPSIKDDMEDPRLPSIVERLIFWGDLSPTYHSSGRYDLAIQDGVRRFQHRLGLDGDGVSGKSTLQALNLSPEYRVKQLIGNLERWRWLPEDLGHKHIIVNIPSFELKGVIDDQVVMHKPVIVGRNYRRTPIFSSKINQLILNPIWTVPPKLAVEDKLPEIQRDHTFFKKLGIVVYERDRVVDVEGVNWRKLNKNNFPFRLVQQPGPQNALGQVKFMIPNTDDIYLHDTPSRNLFSRAERAFSSGCVRVHKPLELAEWLLADQGWDMAKIESEVATGITQAIPLKKPVPVHLEYWTAIVDDAGKVSFRADLYDRDLALWQALNTPISNTPRT